jgi:preprotein translocase subunit SecA
MNEILAILMIAFFKEVNLESLAFKQECNENLEEVSGSAESISSFIFDFGHSFADIYWGFDRILQLGVKQLYKVSKDLATLKQEIYNQLKIDAPANSQKNDNHEIQQRAKELLEKAYEEEKQKRYISIRCNRIYDTFLKNTDEELHEHLISNQVSPEL